MEGIKNFLHIINENWTTILVCIGLIVGIVQKTKNYLIKSDDEKVEMAKKEISNAILKMITDAEKDYSYLSKAGQIKRSHVIKKLYEDYPVLNKVKDQNELIIWIDEQIDSSLKTLREVIKETMIEEGLAE